MAAGSDKHRVSDTGCRKSGKRRICRGIKNSLAIATTTLLAQTPPQSALAENWRVDAGLLYYGEQDGRVQDISFKSVAQKSLGDEDEINVSVQLDSLTGASPSGALPINQAQTITSASGNQQYSIAAGELPLDDSFKDTRAALTGSITRGLTAVSRYTAGASLSKEYDYLHLGTNASYTRDFNNRNTTVSAGLAYSRDTIEAVGGSPEPLSFLPGPDQVAVRNSTENKSVIDGLIGVTQILNRRSLIQLNYSVGLSDGYLNDPYKIISVLDSQTGAPVTESGTDGFRYRFEARPDSRLGHNLYTEFKYRFDAGIVNLGYRYHTDDWGIDSHTLETRYRWLIDSKQYLEPSVRYYSQTQADFYTPFLNEGTLQRYASSDYRLGAFDAITLGLLYNRKLSKQTAIGARVELYRTSGKATGLPGSQSPAEYPDLEAWITQINYTFEF